MIYFWSFVGVFLTALMGYVMFQAVPTLISSDNWSDVITGLFLILSVIGFGIGMFIDFKVKK